MKKKGIFFSSDALIALVIILLSIILIYPIISYSNRESFLADDMLTVLSSLKVGEMDNAYVQELISQKNITNLNKSLLEQIGEFYVINPSLAKSLAEVALSSIDSKENIGIWYGNTLLASRNSSSFEDAKNIEASRQSISGIKEGESISGFSARAWLSNSLQKKYYYFGGYVGDGNISILLESSGTLKNVELEIASDRDFKVYINNQLSGQYENSSSPLNPAYYDLSSYLPIFINGTNTIELVGVDGNMYIAGGYIKLTYEDSVQYEQSTKYYFPGIKGLANIYDGFYVPGELNNLNIFLHLDANESIFLSLGNTTVFSGATVGEGTITLDNSQLSSMLDYNEMSRETIPLRLGTENVSYIIQLDIDIFSVTELSGSVNQNVPVAGKKQLILIQEGNDVFITTVLGTQNTRVGLVAYDGDADDESRNHNLSTDQVSLNDTVYNWSGGEPTCVCCGINKAVEKFLNQSTSLAYKSMVLMSDGKANSECPEQNTGSAKQDAIQAACSAYNNYGIKVNVIGFGPTTTIDEDTLKNISACGNGSYYYSNATELAAIYKKMAEEIIRAAYKEQTIISTDKIYTTIYPDSYIEFNYTPESLPYGLVTTIEKRFDSAYSGEFSIPPNSVQLETKIISYSGPRWTNNVFINNISVYNLSSYGENYVKLGDPYTINIPNSLIQENNIIELTTGQAPENSSPGSEYNKIIYTLLKNVSSYSPIVPTAEGCTWDIEFIDDSNITIIIPPGYPGTDECYYRADRQEYNNNDAVQNAVYKLFKILDFDNDGKLDTKFTEQDLQISLVEITGIPYPWSTEVQVRTWS